MNYNPNQECLPAEIFTNYKIPRKADAATDNIGSYSTPLEWGVMNVGLQGPWCQTPAVISAPAVYKRPLEKEVPKNVKTNNRPFKDACPDLSDPSLPKELTSQFQPLYCKLCQSHLNSNVNAMLHYKSKNHEKRVRRFLTEHAERTGEPLHKKARPNPEQSLAVEDPRHSYCETCDLQLTSKMHAEQHYMGRNHQKALVSKKPAGSGYYDEEGKWHRTAKPKDDITGRNGIGLSFSKPEDYIGKIPPQGKFYCTICSVSTTSSEHLEKHYSGQKHQKALRKLGADVEPTREPVPCISVPPACPDRRGAASCRTPSGQYYCQPCNVALNSEAQFLQHLDSKKHLKNKMASVAKKPDAPYLP